MRLAKILSQFLLPVVCAGCTGTPADTPTVVPATGIVLYNGTPLPGATVTFLLDKSPIATGITDSDGRFSMTTGSQPGATVGNAKISISSDSVDHAKLYSMPPQEMANLAAGGNTVTAPVKDGIPSRYNSPDTSGLIATVSPDGTKNVFEFRLVD